VERAAVKEQERMNLRHGAIYAPSGAHLAPVDHESLRCRTEFHGASIGLF